MSYTDAQRKIARFILAALMTLTLIATPILNNSAEAGPSGGGSNVISTG